MSAIDNETTESTKTIHSLWDVKGLKQQVARMILRSHKKIGKVNQRLSKARETLDRLTGDDAASLEELEQCPNVDALELELSQLQTRLQGLNVIEESLHQVKKKQTVLEPDLAALALELGVDDCPPPRQERGAGKRKGPRSSESKSRLPYRRYYSSNNIEIRVGKKAEDNDELSLSSKHRDGSDWWMQ